METQERIDKAELTVALQRKKLSELIKEYEQVVIQGDTNALVDVKDKFLGYLFYTRRIEVGLLDLSRTITTIKKTIERSEFLSCKRSGEKGMTDTICKYNAEIAAKTEALQEHISEILYREMRAINQSADDFRDQIIQRISVAKKEQFDSRNITT